jgi:hypothetical protein
VSVTVIENAAEEDEVEAALELDPEGVLPLTVMLRTTGAVFWGR